MPVPPFDKGFLDGVRSLDALTFSQRSDGCISNLQGLIASSASEISELMAGGMFKQPVLQSAGSSRKYLLRNVHSNSD